MKFLQEKPITYIIITGVVGFILGLVAFNISHILDHKSLGKSKNSIFTNPALNYSELNEIISSNKIINMSKEMQDYASYKESIGQLSHLSIFYRNLNNGGSFGVNQDEKFSPASLMKLPILIAYVRKSELIPGFLEQKIVYKKDPSIVEYNQNIPPEEKLKEGKEYTLREICEYMIKYSDNNASSFLEKNIPFDDLQKTFTDIGISFPEFKDGKFENNVKIIDYASFFRILFNGSYLNRRNSEKVLNLLSQIQFHEGINLGLPEHEDILVSHKFGERGIIGSNGREEKQLHDCGIVYYPNHPYVICIMTRGYDRNVLKSTIGEVSKLVYDKVKKTYGEDPLDTSNNGTNLPIHDSPGNE